MRFKEVCSSERAHDVRADIARSGKDVSALVFGLTAQEWALCRARLESLLADAAASRSTVTYGAAAQHAFDGRFSARSHALMALLAEVDSAMLEERGIMIATLVVRADTGRPGDGYFAFAESTGDCVGNREEYWSEQAERVWTKLGDGGGS